MMANHEEDHKKDNELNGWRQQWNSVAEPSPDFQRKIRQRIKLEDRRYVLGNVLTAVLFAGILILAVVVRHRANSLGTGWATGLCVLVVASVGYRVWAMRGTWRPEAQSTRAFVELWHRRVLARLRMLQVSIYLSLGWIIASVALTVANWATIGPDVKAHSHEWLGLLLACVLMQPVLWFSATWFRRHKMAELREVKIILYEMDATTGAP